MLNLLASVSPGEYQGGAWFSAEGTGVVLTLGVWLAVAVCVDDGLLFARRDGQRWAAAGYKVTRNKINNAVSVEAATAPEDHTNDSLRAKSAAA